jgi:fibro-slime domain-containing protein
VSSGGGVDQGAGATSAGGARDELCLDDSCSGGSGGGGFGAVGQSPTSVCGDGELGDDEACDDGGLVGGDGCGADCRLVEPGFLCTEPGKACRPFAKCGDSLLSFPEPCDDGNVVDSDGCSDTCKVEIGWKCDGMPSSCSTTTCGDSLVEGAELCDDGNTLPFDGCGVECQIEPQCTVGGGCTSVCGDGIVLGSEQCDDANDIDEDGCSAACDIEAGYACPGEPCEEINGECVLRVPAIFRDFPASHPDMEDSTYGNSTGMVAATLDDEGKPVPESPGNVTGLAGWYRDFEGGNTGPNLGEVVLFDDGTGKFINRYLDDGTRWEAPVGTPVCQANVNDGMPCPVDGNPGFFPVDDIENPADTERFLAEAPQEFYGGYGIENEFPDPRNFHFTTEVTYWFVFDPAANAQLTFVGDDDVWVFINGYLAVDIGNLHVPTGGRIQLGATQATVGYSTDQAGAIWDETTRPVSDFGLMAGEAYEIKVFHAERQTLASSFQLTLAGFDTSRSDCSPDCGDGIIGVGEECDDGDNDGGHNECQPGCVLGGYCGDGIVQEEEACDDGDPNAPAGCAGCRIIVIK